jgi:hypothetical protein
MPSPILVCLWRWQQKQTNITSGAAQIAEQITWPVLTCEAVLAETAFHLQSSERVLELLKDNLVRIAFDCTKHVEHLRALATRYADRKPDLADLWLIRMSEL